MRKSTKTVTIKTAVTMRREMWEGLNHYMGNPAQARRVVYEALRRFWLKLKEREKKQIRASIGHPNHLN